MTINHKTLAFRSWDRLPFLEQMAHIGSEVERVISWREKNNPTYSQSAFERALELLDLTIRLGKNKSSIRELTRLRELLVDYFVYDNTYSSSDEFWRSYFYPFNYACRRHT